MKSYRFETANMGTCEITISGEWVGGGVDIDVAVGRISNEFSDIDAGNVDHVFGWLIRNGVEFESNRSLWFNFLYVRDIMVDRCRTEAQLLDEVANETDEELAAWREWL